MASLGSIVMPSSVTQFTKSRDLATPRADFTAVGSHLHTRKHTHTLTQALHPLPSNRTQAREHRHAPVEGHVEVPVVILHHDLRRALRSRARRAVFTASSTNRPAAATQYMHAATRWTTGPRAQGVPPQLPALHHRVVGRGGERSHGVRARPREVAHVPHLIPRQALAQIVPSLSGRVPKPRAVHVRTLCTNTSTHVDTRITVINLNAVQDAPVVCWGRGTQ